MSHRSWAILGCLALAPVAAAEDDPLDPLASISAEDFLAHVKWLADDAREGRLTGAPGERAATAYVAERFAEWGLKPLGENGSWFQEFPVGKRPVLGEGNACTLSGPAGAVSLAVESDWLPLGSAPAATVEAPLVFAGYALETKDWNDFAGLDVKGKVVVAVRLSAKAQPKGVKIPVPAFFGAESLYQRQVKAAAEHGAVAVLLVPGRDDPDTLGVLTVTRRTDAMPVVRVRRAAIVPWLLAAGCDVARWEAGVAAGESPARPAPTATIRLTTAVRSAEFTGRNVIGILEGTDPARRHEAVVIGAHADHVGRNEASNATDQNNEIHNGADDNASGTAGMLEVAQAFATCAYRPSRTVIFMSFTGEELGLIGSQFWVRKPTWPIENVVAMVNLDMIGRAKDGLCNVESVDSGEGLAELVQARNAVVGLTLKVAKGIRPDSDHYPFISKGIPGVFLFTGMHPQYHKSTDDADLINGPDGARTAQLAFLVVAELASREGRIAYRKPARPAAGARPARMSGVRIGFAPAYDFEGEGVKVETVSPDGVGARCGLADGDVIVRLGERKLKDLNELMEVMGTQKPGTSIECEVRRGNATKVLTFTWDAAAAEPAPGAAPEKGVRMGVMLGEEGAGAVLDSVLPDMPAAKAGLVDGDLVVRVGDKKIESAEDLRVVLGELTRGSTVEVEVLRGKDKKVVTVRFE